MLQDTHWACKLGCHSHSPKSYQGFNFRPPEGKRIYPEGETGLRQDAPNKMIDGNGQFRCAMIDSIEFGLAFGGLLWCVHLSCTPFALWDMAACCNMAETAFCLVRFLAELFLYVRSCVQVFTRMSSCKTGQKINSLKSGIIQIKKNSTLFSFWNIKQNRFIFILQITILYIIKSASKNCTHLTLIERLASFVTISSSFVSFLRIFCLFFAEWDDRTWPALFRAGRLPSVCVRVRRAKTDLRMCRRIPARSDAYGVRWR